MSDDFRQKFIYLQQLKKQYENDNTLRIKKEPNRFS
jgi:hypothetical protein